MGTAPQAKAELSSLFGLYQGTFDRYVSNLAADGFVRRSGRGGGKAAVHLNDVEIAHIVLSMSSAQSGGASAAVHALRRLWPEHPQAGDASFVTDFAGMIASFGREMQRGADPTVHIPDGWTLTISLDPLMAWYTIPLQDGTERKQYFVDEANGHEQSEQPAIRHLTVITKAAVIAAARLCADSPEQSAILASPPAPQGAGTTNENAAPGRAAPSNASVRDVSPPEHTTSTSSPNTCDDTARVCAPSTGTEPPRPKEPFTWPYFGLAPSTAL